jgi:hypothetical protein
MRKLCHDLFWLLSGGVGNTIRQRNALKAQLEIAQQELANSRALQCALEEKLRRAAEGRQLPYILLNALPKSGSTYLMESLRQGLQIPEKEISNGYIPLDVINYHKIKSAALGHGIARTHLDVNPTNLKLLKKFLPSMVLQLRDPRQALLSWVHHVRWYMQNNYDLLFASVTPFPPDSIKTSTLSYAIDWHLTHHFSNLLEWMERWLEHVESGAAPVVLLTQFKEFRENPDQVVAQILAFYDIPTWAYHPKELPKDQSTHYRKGELDEWRDVFNSAQKQICAELMKGYPRVNRLYGELSSQVTENLQQPEPLHVSAANNGSQPHASVQKIESAITASPR